MLKVKAKDFSAPTFNISVQPGFASDLSGAGIITNGFTSQDASQVALLQRTIDTVNEVNSTLNSASSQVAQVRQSLDDTSATLGKDAAEHLKTQNESLTKTMQGLQANIENLQKDLSEASRTNNSQLISQLERTVAALHTMLVIRQRAPMCPFRIVMVVVLCIVRRMQVAVVYTVTWSSSLRS